MLSLRNEIVKFYIPYRQETCSERLEFPMWFKAFVGEALPKEIFLMNQRMNIWTVEITVIGDGLYFKNGWEKFVRENSIKNGDLMVFKYEGYGMFEIVVIDDI
nr:B3 domain-containing protein Os03g0620500-like [Ipomoea batatas]